jgi:hypothetical protein
LAEGHRIGAIAAGGKMNRSGNLLFGKELWLDECLAVEEKERFRKLISIIFKNSVHTSKKTQHFANTKINWLILFKEIIVV